MKILNVDAPLWFIQWEIGIQLVFALVTILLALYAYRIYRISRQNNSFYFGAAFLSISIGYFIEAIFNFLLLRHVHTADVLSLFSGKEVQSTVILSVFVVFIHMVFMLTGFSILAYLTLKQRNIKTFFLILLLSLAGIIFARDISLMFYILLSLLLVFVSLQYRKRFLKKPSADTLMVSLAFGIIFLGTLQLALASSLGALYISGHVVILAGYLLLLVNLMRVVGK